MGLLRVNNLGDTTGAVNPITLSSSGATTATWSTAPTNMPVVASPDFLKLVVEPNTSAEEITYVTAYAGGSATSATVLRAQEGSSAATHTAKPWICAPSARDFTTTPTKVVSSAYAMAAADAVVLVASDVSLADSGPSSKNLVVAAGVVGSVNGFFGGGAVALSTVSQIGGQAGSAVAEGAITGSAWSCEFIYSAPSYASTPYVIGRSSEWYILINPTGTVQVIWYDSGGTAHYFNSGTNVIGRGVPTSVAVCWNGTSVFVFVNGTLDGTYAMTTHFAPVATTGMLIFYTDNVTGALIEELRISAICQHTTSYTPAVSPFAAPAAGCLYHFYGGVTLPSPATAGAGATYTVKSTGGPFLVRPYASETLDGAAVLTGYPLGSFKVVTDATNWFVLSSVAPVELAYNQVTASVTTSGVTPYTTGMPTVTVFCTGAPIRVELWCGELYIDTIADNGNLSIMMDGASAASGTVESGTGNTAAPATIVYRGTPTAGYHTFTGAITSNAGNVHAFANSGYPMFIRVTQ